MMARERLNDAIREIIRSSCEMIQAHITEGESVSECVARMKQEMNCFLQCELQKLLSDLTLPEADLARVQTQLGIDQGRDVINEVKVHDVQQRRIVPVQGERLDDMLVWKKDDSKPEGWFREELEQAIREMKPIFADIRLAKADIQTTADRLSECILQQVKAVCNAERPSEAEIK